MPRAGTSCSSSSTAACRCKGKFAPVWDRGPRGWNRVRQYGRIPRAGKPRARARRAAPARMRGFRRSHSRPQPAQAGEIEATLRRQWDAIAATVDRAHAAIISGAAGFEPATSAEARVLKEIGLPVRNTGTYIGHGLEAQFMANLGIACAALEHGRLFAPTGSGDMGRDSVFADADCRDQCRQLAWRRPRAH